MFNKGHITMSVKKNSKSYEHQFPRDNGSFLIELRLSSLNQFFNTFDPSPFHDKDIDDDAERYIVNSIKGFPLKARLKLVFYLKQEHQVEASSVLPYAIENYFGFRAAMASSEMRSLLQEGRLALIMGSLFLFLCMSARAALSFLSENTFGNIMLEGLSITGWVAMWKPIHIFLYEWWSHYRIKKIYEKIRDIPIEISLDSEVVRGTDHREVSHIKTH